MGVTAEPVKVVWKRWKRCEVGRGLFDLASIDLPKQPANTNPSFGKLQNLDLLKYLKKCVMEPSKLMWHKLYTLQKATVFWLEHWQQQEFSNPIFCTAYQHEHGLWQGNMAAANVTGLSPWFKKITSADCTVKPASTIGLLKESAYSWPGSIRNPSSWQAFLKMSRFQQRVAGSPLIIT